MTCNSLFKHNIVEIVVHSQLAKIRPSSVKFLQIAGLLKVHVFNPLGIKRQHIVIEVFLLVDIQLKENFPMIYRY